MSKPLPEPNFELLWSALPFPAFVIGPQDAILGANGQAEHLLSTSLRQMRGKNFCSYFGDESALADTVGQVRAAGSSVTQYFVDVTAGDKAPITSNVHVSTLPATGQEPPLLLVILQPTAAAQKMTRSLTHLSAARSVTGMAAMLAHEIRNPLAGISGAAQLLEMNAGAEDTELTQMIVQEATRIGQLVDRVEHFGDQRPMARRAVNIHDILDRARRAARAGFAQAVEFQLNYDPSLPEAAGDPDQLLQVFQNLFKNSAEAMDRRSPVIVLRTSYHSGVKLAVSGGRTENLPLQIEVTDNGRGIPRDLIGEVFDPFVSSKANGTGLGLSLVSKIIADHGGLVECTSVPGKTTFRLRLPVWRGKGEAG
jgi:two-component system, NtrC family, nitrogen regulation sensor histidine kinase GlnL